MKVSLLLNAIQQKNLVLPEFQREYVWRRDRARELMVSLFKDYPVGGLLFWQTDSPPELKNINVRPDKLGAVRVILDGQQRLTTLHLLIEGTIPHYYTGQDLQNDPRDLHFHVGTSEFQYYLRSHMSGDPLWQRVVDCFDQKNEIRIFEIAEQVADGNKEEAFRLANQYNENLNRLRNIRDRDIPEQVVPAQASVTEAIDIFDRTNSLGTKLTDAELALTHVTGTWAAARRVLKDKSAELDESHFGFDLTVMTRALTAVVMHRALYETIHGADPNALKAGWGRLSKRLDYLVTILPSQAFIHSTDDLATPNVLIPLLVYLDVHDGRFPSDKAMRQALHWLYAAQMWQRYTAQTDQRLEHDVSIVVKEDVPWPALCDQIIDQRGRLEVKGGDMDGRWITHPMFRMAVIVAKAHGAVDWFNGAPLGAVVGKSYQLHAHHIFPQALLYRSGYDSDNHLHRKIINEIANRAFLTAETNLELRDTPPADYLPAVEERYAGALTKQFVPVKPELWHVERFRDFLAARRDLMAKKINEFMDCLVAEPEVQVERSVDELRQLNESATLEFKSTLRWDVIQGRVNKELQFSVLRTIVAFLNSDGGTLLIGVEDNGNAHGITQDLRSFGKPTTDTFEQTLLNLVAEHIGAGLGAILKVRFEQADGTTVCRVDVAPSSEPAYLSTQRGKEFFIRVGNTSRALDAQETVSYINSHWL